MIFTCPCAWIAEASGGIFGLGGCLAGSVTSNLDMNLRRIEKSVELHICLLIYLCTFSFLQ